MPRDNDKNNDSRGRRDRPSGGKARSGAARGQEKKFAKRGFGGKDERDKRPYAGKPDGARSYAKKPYAGSGKAYAGKREGASPRRDYADAPRRDYGDTPRPPRFNRDDRPRGDGEKRPYTPRGERGESRPPSRFAAKKFADKRPYAPPPPGPHNRPHTPPPH